MPAQFTVLASGSSGNSAFLQMPDFGLLIDCGIGPRVFSERLAATNAKWPNISAVILTHTHSDHWNRPTFSHLQRLRIPLIIHADHARYFEQNSSEFPTLQKANLVRYFVEGQSLDLTPHLSCRPIRVSHDSDPTFAFRLDGTNTDTGCSWSLGYASDLGHTTPALMEAFAGVEVLALEFNHDVELQRRSRRTQLLIQRVLGDRGHLSNEQAAAFVQQLLAVSPEPLRHLFQLHLSRECNRPELAQSVGRAMLLECSHSTNLITAHQDRSTPTISLVGCQRSDTRMRSKPVVRASLQPSLPGME